MRKFNLSRTFREEWRRILRSAARKAMALEQSHWPRKHEEIERTKRVHAYAEKHNAWDRG